MIDMHRFEKRHDGRNHTQSLYTWHIVAFVTHLSHRH